jgi:predicted transglutaminase-like cysteine proteinase
MNKRLLEALHKDVLSHFRWTADKVLHGKLESWDVPEPDERGIITGDCDDFVLYCHQRLAAAGVAEADMWPVTCRDEMGEWHVILAVQLGGETFALDNRQRRLVTLRDLDDAGYGPFYRPAGAIDRPWQVMEV